MAKCELLPTCKFFNDELSAMPDMADHMKEKYCLASFDRCARFAVFTALGRGSVPGDLFPVEAQRAEQIIGGLK
jgi:hypothetical protein